MSKKLLMIGEVAKKLNLLDKKTGKPKSSILRFWETQFKEIKPISLRGIRYYSKNQVELLKFIKYLLKDKQITILGVKKILKNKTLNLDDQISKSIKEEFSKKLFLEKALKIKKKIKDIRNGKKNTYKG